MVAGMSARPSVLGRAKAALAGDELVAAGAVLDRAHENRLQHVEAANALGELGELRFVESLARVGLRRGDRGERYPQRRRRRAFEDGAHAASCISGSSHGSMLIVMPWP
jgi:hypothetical protein